MSYQVRVDNELYEFLLSEAAEKGEAIGEALRRVLERHGVPVPSRRRRTLFAERRREIYRLPILVVLIESGGEARVEDIKAALFSKIRNQLDEAERTGRKSNRAAWWYDAEYERFEMIRDGLIDGTSPRGRWKLTAKGSDVLRGGEFRAL